MPKVIRDMLGRQGLTRVDEALAILLARLGTVAPQTDTVPLASALDRITAGRIVSPEDLPTHARSTMDGFAVQAVDTFGASESMPVYLRITGKIAMGEQPAQMIERGCCAQIPTGGLLPPGTDAVVMLEHTVPIDESMIEIVKAAGVGANLIAPGEDIGKNGQALPAGHRLRPQDLGLLAGLGLDQVEVCRRLTVGVLSTGDEIVPHTEVPPPGKVRDINGITLSALIRRAGAKATLYGIVSDRKEIFFPAVEKAVSENDLVLFSGGSSVGMRDLGEQAIASLGNPGILVHGVALKPGKPIIIGLTGTTPIFGLPGHPVSAMVCFELFVEPTIRRLSGLAAPDVFPRAVVLARLARNINSAPGRRDLIRVQLSRAATGWVADPVLGKSGAITTISRAHGYFLIDEDSQGFTQDTEVEVTLYL
ncbi:MAG: molybdopterin molybdotransferase MoeA [Deltaproteobacteria bacterium]|nr:molybdopterin molybdotransferase MoeA [Deltaproteobacteria bacterium]